MSETELTVEKMRAAIEALKRDQEEWPTRKGQRVFYLPPNAAAWWRSMGGEADDVSEIPQCPPVDILE